MKNQQASSMFIRMRGKAFSTGGKLIRRRQMISYIISGGILAGSLD